MHRHHIRPEFDYLADEAGCGFVSAQSVVYHTEQMLCDQASEIFL